MHCLVKLNSLCPASFLFQGEICLYSRCFLISYFCIPVPYNEKYVFLDVSSRWSCRSSSVQFSSLAESCPTLCDPMNHSIPGPMSITNSRSSLRLMSIGLVMPSSHLILCRHLFLLYPVPPSIRVFSNKSILRMMGPKYWSLSLSISPSNEHPGLISLRIDWLDLLADQGTLRVQDQGL